jgi:hypothetical protein
MSPLLPIGGLLLLGYALSRRTPAPTPPQLGGGFVRTIAIPPIFVEPGSTWFLVVLDTTAMNSGAGIGRALQDHGWEPSGAFQQRGMIPPGNPYSAQGMQYVFPVTWMGTTLEIIDSLPWALGTGLYILDGNPHAPPTPL